jgi:hypothetical protein
MKVTVSKFKLIWGIMAPEKYNFYGKEKIEQFKTKMMEEYDFSLGFSYFIPDNAMAKSYFGLQAENPIIGIHIIELDNAQGSFGIENVNQLIEEAKEKLPINIINHIQLFLNTNEEPQLFYTQYPITWEKTDSSKRGN